MKEQTILIIPDKADPERDSMARIWATQYGAVLKVGKFWIKPETGGKRVALYGYDSFCLVLAQILKVEMISPRDEMIREFDFEWIQRTIELKEIGAIETIAFPKFVKPVIPKLFKGQVYQTLDELRNAVTDIKSNEKILVSTIIAVESEVRTFILERTIQDLAFYEGEGDLEDARLFAERFLNQQALQLPQTFVMDLGYNSDLGWFIIELNSCWGAGLNGCDPEKVIECVQRATRN